MEAGACGSWGGGGGARNVGRKKKKGEDFPNTGNDAGKIIKAGMLTGRDVSTDS